MVVNVSRVPKVEESKRFLVVELADGLPTGVSLGPPLLKRICDALLTPQRKLFKSAESLRVSGSLTLFFSHVTITWSFTYDRKDTP
jgi:hypothetical protein